uniref:Uncharacterized protein n=1 Tax=Kuenenia stuttgartiensis TaxID=174633 RepID=Q1PWS1_KUEST|nr:unknown protein [Candidatus Kuenenia stuttgartiensis]
MIIGFLLRFQSHVLRKKTKKPPIVLCKTYTLFEEGNGCVHAEDAFLISVDKGICLIIRVYSRFFVISAMF